jgi:hypothetical protein
LICRGLSYPRWGSWCLIAFHLSWSLVAFDFSTGMIVFDYSRS